MVVLDRLMLRHTRMIVPYLLTAIATSVLTVVVVLIARPVPGIALLDVHEMDGVAPRGGVLDLVTQAKRPPGCFPTVTRWLWRVDPLGDGVDDLEWVQLLGAPDSPPIDAPGLPSPTNRDNRVRRYRLPIQLPPQVEEGEWHYLGIAIDHCDNSTLARRTPDFVITVTKSDAKTPAMVLTPPGPVTLLPSVK